MKFRVIYKNNYPTYFYTRKEALSYIASLAPAEDFRIEKKVGSDWLSYTITAGKKNGIATERI